MTPWVRSQEDIAVVLRSLAGSRSIALDSESDSLHHFFEKVCLVQLALESGDAYLVDPLVLRDLSPLGPILADGAVRKVLHGADYDVTTLKRDFGFTFAGLFDTMIAARFLGETALSLQALAQKELGVALSKESQKDDWSRRPLTPIQEAYALADVRHLLELAGRLEGRLKELGRLAWVLEECDAVARLEPARRRADPDAYQRVKGAGRLGRRGLAVLREVYLWREGLASEADVPSFKIASSELLLQIAEHPPRSLPELQSLRGIPSRLQSRLSTLLEAIDRGLGTPEASLPTFPRRARPVVLEAARRKNEALKAFRSREATRLGVEVAVVLPQRLIDQLVELTAPSLSGLATVEGIRTWRIETFGKAILETLA